MFKPKYSITPNVLNNLIKTVEAKTEVLNYLEDDELCVGRGPGALWKKKGITSKRG